MRKKQRLNQAKSLLKTKSIDEVLERIPGLTYKALERARIIRGKILNWNILDKYKKPIGNAAFLAVAGGKD